MATGALTPLTSEPDVKSCIRLSPDRQRLAFMQPASDSASAGVEIMRIDGTGRQTVDGRMGDWAPDSQHILVIDDASGNAFWSVALDGSGHRLIKPAEPSSDREVPGCGNSQETSALLWLPNQ